ncbi:hypothetical protein [Rhodoferax sp. PAMC 29310]|uniref:hypothetical protein n=1 Tax=Rhodoferax sp. PAMC 29310 TaxID=2822760 RepID=UPI001B31E4D3|nr:hypothetical protein [Rhodoferax sp. PAMC 29310]
MTSACRASNLTAVYTKFGTPSQAAPPAVLDAKALLLGDGRVSTEAKRGYVFACATQFRGSGARHAGDWIQGDTWDATRKILVQGEVYWSDARFTMDVSGEQRVLTGNALPVGQATGLFPIQRQDPAFQIDRNPNAIVAQSIRYVLPVAPAQAGDGGPASRATQVGQPAQAREGRPSGQPRPPAVALDACAGQTDGSACSLNGPMGRALIGQCRQRGRGAAVLACVPAGR